MSDASSEDDDSDEDSPRPIPRKSFLQAKGNALGKLDKSSAGKIDPRAVSVCALINGYDFWYTTSSCSGRCYLWRGVGVKATTEFRRGRVSHEKIDASYFLQESDEDPTGFQRAPFAEHDDEALWLRFEPFILHVRCRTRRAAGGLVQAARAAGLKNVGETDGFVSIVGDDGLEMPLRTPKRCLFTAEEAEWLVALVNEKHDRNWAKIRKLQAEIPTYALSEKKTKVKVDVIGDVAILISAPDDMSHEEILRHVSKKQKAKVLVRVSAETIDETAHRARRYTWLAGAKREPLVTTHSEHGVRIVVDLDRVFFSPKLALERARLCRCVGRGETVLALFCGCGPEVLAMATRTDVGEIIAVDANEVAIRCLDRSLETLRRHRPNAANKITVFCADAISFLSTQSRCFDRILAPRPKHPSLDGDRTPGDTSNLDAFGGPGGINFLRALLPKLRDGGVVHWTDFAADWELPQCQRTRDFLHNACPSLDIIHLAKAGPSVAKRQFRIAIDFRLEPSVP